MMNDIVPVVSLTSLNGQYLSSLYGNLIWYQIPSTDLLRCETFNTWILDSQPIIPSTVQYSGTGILVYKSIKMHPQIGGCPVFTEVGYMTVTDDDLHVAFAVSSGVETPRRVRVPESRILLDVLACLPSQEAI